LSAHRRIFQIPKFDGFRDKFLVTELFLANRENYKPKNHQKTTVKKLLEI